MARKSAVENITESNRLGVELLINDARTALTFLDVAESANSAEERSRRVAEAHHAYKSIVSFLGRLAPNAEQMQILRDDLEILARRLRAAGVRLN